MGAEATVRKAESEASDESIRQSCSPFATKFASNQTTTLIRGKRAGRSLNNPWSIQSALSPPISDEATSASMSGRGVSAAIAAYESARISERLIHVYPG